MWLNSFYGEMTCNEEKCRYVNTCVLVKPVWKSTTCKDSVLSLFGRRYWVLFLLVIGRLVGCTWIMPMRLWSEVVGMTMMMWYLFSLSTTRHCGACSVWKLISNTMPNFYVVLFNKRDWIINSSHDSKDSHGCYHIHSAYHELIWVEQC